MSMKTIFRVFILLFFSIGGQISVNAQTTTPFEMVFDACKKACEALEGGFASGEQLLAVSKTLRDAAPIPLTVKQTQGDVLSLKVRGSIQNVAWTKCRTKYVKPLVHR